MKCRVWVVGFRVHGLGFQGEGWDSFLEFRVQGYGFRIEGSGFGV